MTIGTINKVKSPSDRLGEMIGSFSMQWSSLCFSDTPPLFLSHVHSPCFRVSNTASLPKSLLVETDFNFTSQIGLSKLTKLKPQLPTCHAFLHKGLLSPTPSQRKQTQGKTLPMTLLVVKNRTMVCIRLKCTKS